MRLAKKYPRLMLTATGIGFLVSGIDCLDNNLALLAAVSFIVGAINIIASLVVLKHPFSIRVTLLAINSLFAFISSYAYYEAGRDKIQYGWAAVGVISIIAIVVAFRKRAKDNMEPGTAKKN
ncbi:MAG: hypothetical protein R2727_09750 [Bacteroidales bacterium]